MNQQLFSKISGQGHPLIILHGLLGTSDNWQTIANQMSENFTVCLLDLRNHGRSFHSDIFNYDAMVEDVIHFMESHWIQSADFIGHSMGGKVAMNLALREPDLVNKLIVADIGVKNYPPGHLIIFEALRGLDLKTLPNRKSAQDFLMEKLHDHGVVQFLLKNLTREKDGGFSWKMNLDGIIDNYTKIMAGLNTNETFTKPTLFVKGANSNYILNEDQIDILHFFPDALFETIPEAGHWLHADQPEIFTKVCTDFLLKGTDV